MGLFCFVFVFVVLVCFCFCFVVLFCFVFYRFETLYMIPTVEYLGRMMIEVHSYFNKNVTNRKSLMSFAEVDIW